MTRNEAISIINSRLASLDDERVLTVADIIKEMTTGDDLPRALTERELALIAQSKADFAAGRATSPDESRAYVEAALAERRAARSKA